MGKVLILICFVSCLARAADPPAKVEPLPENARKLLQSADQDVEKARKKFLAEELAIKAKLISDLQKLLEAETKKGNLDSALAIRSTIEQFKQGPVKIAAPEDPQSTAIKKLLVGGRWSFAVLGTPYSAVWEFQDDGSIMNSDAASADKKWSIETVNKNRVLRVGSCIFQLTQNNMKLSSIKTTSNEKVELVRIAN